MRNSQAVRRGKHVTEALWLSLAFVLAGTHAFAADPLMELGARVVHDADPLPPFTLIDNSGTPFTGNSLSGKWTLLFFGYTHCPDVCPTTMAVLNNRFKALTEIFHGKDNLQVVFVSVDPYRDDVAKLNEYVAFFNPAFRGVTGEISDLIRLSKGMNTRFNYFDPDTRKAFPQVAQRPPVDNYVVGHMGDVFVFAPDGRLTGMVFPPHEPERMVAAVAGIREQVSAGRPLSQ